MSLTPLKTKNSHAASDVQTDSNSQKPSSALSCLRLGIGGPVGSGDIYTKEDSEFLTRNDAMPAERIRGVETGGCPHTAIREDASINLTAIAELQATFEGLELIIIESGGDNLAATFSPELSDLTLYVIDVSAGDKIPRKGGPGLPKEQMSFYH